MRACSTNALPWTGSSATFGRLVVIRLESPSGEARPAEAASHASSLPTVALISHPFPQLSRIILGGSHWPTRPRRTLSTTLRSNYRIARISTASAVSHPRRWEISTRPSSTGRTQGPVTRTACSTGVPWSTASSSATCQTRSSQGGISTRSR